jgi:hypothetical protein
MTLHINKFLDRVQMQESRANKDFVMPMSEAKNLHSDITRLLLELQSLHDQTGLQKEVITVKIAGGSF